LLFLFKDAFLAKQRPIPILTRPRLEPTIYRTQGEHAKHPLQTLKTDAVEINNGF
jgi:hypothetical protein